MMLLLVLALYNFLDYKLHRSQMTDQWEMIISLVSTSGGQWVVNSSVTIYRVKRLDGTRTFICCKERLGWRGREGIYVSAAAQISAILPRNKICRKNAPCTPEELYS